MMIDRSFSPKTVASALGVSESSLKRWCDCGKIEVTKTVGGHRRIPRNAILNFVRDNRFELAQPELIGLPNLSSVSERCLESARTELLDRLIAGDEVACRRILLELYVAGHRVSRIGDEVLCPVFQEMGSRWECSSIEVYQERLGCEICSRALMELRAMLTQPAPQAPLAIGGTPEQDPYTLPTSLVEMVIAQNGYRAVSLGARIPWDSLLAAIRKMKPDLFWFSVSHLEDVESFLEGYHRLFAEVGGDLPIIVGGRGLTASIRSRMQFTIHCDGLKNLDSFLQNFTPSRRKSTGTPHNSAI